MICFIYPIKSEIKNDTKIETTDDTARELKRCVDTANGAKDRFNFGCDAYVGYAEVCGHDDDEDFIAKEMCCVCGGGGGGDILNDLI